jgi:hypothetical protein
MLIFLYLDGVQLLYLINQPIDACRYLASQGDWARAFSYSKVFWKIRDILTHSSF